MDDSEESGRRRSEHPVALRVCMTVLALIGVLAGQPSARAQYMYLDADGDGVNTPSDGWYLLDRRGEPTTVDLYVSTDQGDQYSCPHATTDGVGLNSYTVNLYAYDAPMTFENVQNQLPGWFETTPLTTYPFAMSVGYSGSSTLPPGTYHLLRMTVTTLPTTSSAGCPALGIVPSSCYSPPGVVTSLESNCPGAQGDGVLRLGEDWSAFGDLIVCTDNTGRHPQISCPSVIEGEVGQGISFWASVIDPDCASNPMYAYDVPAGATLSNLSPFVAGQANQLFSWTPANGQAGVYPITFEVSDPDPFNMRDRRASCVTLLTVRRANSTPTARAGGPYSGMRGVGILFDGSGSSDPDGSELACEWTFGDGNSGVGVEVLHTYASTAGSPYPVTLTVTDGLLADADTTAARVLESLPADVFYPGGMNYIFPQILPTWVWIESIDGSFQVSDIVLSSASMNYNGSTIPSSCKSGGSGDRNHNGAPDVRVCFARNDLRTLFEGLPSGRSDVSVTLEGDLASGGRFHGTVPVHVIKLGFLGAGAMASISPNPLNPEAKLTFVTTVPGTASVQVFDLNGRLIRTLLAQQSLSPGIHEVRVDGRNEQGSRLASGVYYYRVQSVEGISKGAFTVLK